MISKMLATVELICKKCGFKSELGKLARPHSDLNFCPECIKMGCSSILIELKEYQEQKLKEKLGRHLYCLNCKMVGLIDGFPFKSGTLHGDPDDIGDERYCKGCMKSDLINLACLQPCSQCGERPVEKAGEWCVGCEEQYEAAYFAERDFEPWD